MHTFRRKSAAEIKHALGEISNILQQKYFNVESPLFRPIPIPKPGDWLSVHPETGQSFEQFLHSTRRIPSPSRNTIYIQPLGNFYGPRVIPLPLIESYLKAFFYGLQVKILPTVSVKEANDLKPIRSRINSYTGKRQLRCDDILSWFQVAAKRVLPPLHSEIVTLVITTEDIYPDNNWNFVFGIAYLRYGIGVWSLARMDPHFPNDQILSQQPTPQEQEIILKRSLKVISHEIAHMFGIHHCVYFSCLMNGSNHLEERDKHPMFLCPIDLRKLWAALQFDIKERYQSLLQFFEENRFEECNWVRERLKEIQ